MTNLFNPMRARRREPARRQQWGRTVRKSPQAPLAIFQSCQTWLDPNCDHDTWFRILAACKSGDDSEAMREACRVWSSGGASFNERDFNATWNSIRADGGIGLGTMIKLAQDAGWPGVSKRHSNPPSRPLAPRAAPTPTQPPPEEKICGWPPPGNTVAVYYYNRPDGSPLYRKIRLMTPTGKITPFQRYDPTRDVWIGGPRCMAGVERVLYRNEQLPGFQQVFVVEGEKCADCLWDLGFMAVCNDSGAGHWNPKFSETLRDKDVVILPDNDEPGCKHAEKVARSLVSAARSIKMVELPGLGPKQDVFDWLTQHGDTL